MRGDRQQEFLATMPALIAGVCAWVAFVALGQTPFIRATALALVVTGVAATLSRWGTALGVIGGLALAFSPAFWSQTGGADRLGLPEIALALAVASAATALAAWLSKRPLLGMVSGVVIFTVLFALLVGTPRSLRLTTLLTAWLLFLLVDSLLLTNPRPDEAPAVSLDFGRRLGLLLLLLVGVANDPLFTLFAPAVLLSLLLTRTRLPWWYWALLLGITLYGARGVALYYLDSGWWLYPAAHAQELGIRVPYAMADGWREPSRWLALVGLVNGQFTIVGVILGVIGLARLARWYPALGIVTMIAYAAYALFGLVYFGRDSAVLLLPLLMIQMLWMTYAAYTLGQWLQRSFKSAHKISRWLAPAAFTLLLLFMLWRIANGV